MILGVLRAIAFKQANKNYFKQFGYTIDKLIGGSIYGANKHNGLFGSISANIGYRQDKDKFHYYLAKFVDNKWLFGKGHCARVAEYEGFTI